MSGCVLDTDVVIAALDRSDAHHDAAAGGLKRMIRDNVPLLLSLINYAEALVRPSDDERTMRVAIDAISALDIRLLSPTPDVARDAARLRHLGISLADGFALSAARSQDAAVASFDTRVRRAAEKIGIATAEIG